MRPIATPADLPAADRADLHDAVRRARQRAGICIRCGWRAARWSSGLCDECCDESKKGK